MFREFLGFLLGIKFPVLVLPIMIYKQNITDKIVRSIMRLLTPPDTIICNTK